MRKRVVGIMSYCEETNLYGVIFEEDTDAWICVNSILGGIHVETYRALLGKKVELTYFDPVESVVISEGTAIELKIVSDETPNCYETIQ